MLLLDEVSWLLAVNNYGGVLPATMDVKVSPPTRGVYFHTQILVLAISMSLTKFVWGVLGYYHVPPTQLSSGIRSWVLKLFAALMPPSRMGLTSSVSSM